MCSFPLSSLYYQEGYESDVEEPNDDISFLEALRQQSPPRQTDINMSTEDESEYEPGNSYYKQLSADIKLYNCKVKTIFLAPRCVRIHFYIRRI